jgi:hypothetical protein
MKSSTFCDFISLTRTRIRIRIRTETNADPQHCFAYLQCLSHIIVLARLHHEANGTVTFGAGLEKGDGVETDRLLDDFHLLSHTDNHSTLTLGRLGQQN